MNETNNDGDGEEIIDNAIVFPADTSSSSGGNDDSTLSLVLTESATNAATHAEYTTEQIGRLAAEDNNYGNGNKYGGDGGNDELDKPDSTTIASGIADHESNINISERERNILASINNRRQLLTWIRNCRIETKAVLNEMLMAE